MATESVLEAPPPRFTADEIAAIAAELFGLRGVASDLGSERDQTFLIDDGGGGGVLKISNLGEDPTVLDLETEAILHVSRVDPELPVARLRPSVHGDYRPTIDGPDGTHFVRLFERLHGHAGGPELDDRALFGYGATHARLNLALRDRRLPVAHPARAPSARRPRRPRRRTPGRHRHDQRLARRALPRERGVHPGLGRRLVEAARAVRRNGRR